MIYKFILLQLIAHLTADFLLQPHKWAINKSASVWSRYHFYHWIIVFTVSYLFALDINYYLFAFILSVLHLSIDMIKSSLNKKYHYKNLFFIDQLLHIIIIIAIAFLYNKYFGIHFYYNISLKILLILFGFIFLSKPSNIIIKNIFLIFKLNIPEEEPDSGIGKNSDKSLPNAGKLIGLAERFITFALLLVGQYSVVGLLITAKSILRFRSTQKNEYILVGTMLSFGLAILTGILIKKLI